MIESEAAQSPGGGGSLDGLSLQDAYLLFLRMNFSNPDVPPIEGPGPIVLNSDGGGAWSRVQKRFGLIVRHPYLMTADDDCDGVAMRLTVSNAIDTDEGRDDVLVHRHFWKLFEDGKWKMTGRTANVAADEKAIEPRLFRYFRVFDLRQSSIEDGEFGGARFVDVRVYPGLTPPKLSRVTSLMGTPEITPDIQEADDLGDFYKYAGFCGIGTAAFEEDLDLVSFSSAADFFREITAAFSARAERGEKSFQVKTADERDALRTQCGRFLQQARKRNIRKISSRPPLQQP
jgi:hypothetical protein